MKPAMLEGGRREAYGDGEKRAGMGSGGWPADADRGGEGEGRKTVAVDQGFNYS